MHLAAESHVDRSISGSDAFVRTNVLGTHCLLEAARAYWMQLPKRAQDFRFLHVSTDEVYGSLGPMAPFSEITAYDPSSPYSASKAAADHLAGAWFRTYGLPVIISNCSNNYGPFHFPEKLIPPVILNASRTNRCRSMATVRTCGIGFLSRSCPRVYLCRPPGTVPVRNTTSAVATKRGESLGGRKQYLRSSRRAFAQADSRRGLITFVTDRPGHDRRYAIDASKLERELGWRAVETFDTGLAKTVRWYLDNRAWWSPCATTCTRASVWGCFRTQRIKSDRRSSRLDGLCHRNGSLDAEAALSVPTTIARDG